jgi:glutaredoxin 3
MAKIEIYTRRFCSYCARARALLDKLGLSYTEYELSSDPIKEAEMIERAGRFTVPQIFVDGQPIGGSDELVASVTDRSFFELLNASSKQIHTYPELASHG